MKIILTLSLIGNILLLIFVLSHDNKSVEKRGPASDTIADYHFLTQKSIYQVMPNDSGSIFFLGNSIIHNCEWSELFANRKIKSRGIGGDTIEGITARLSEILKARPSKIFLEIGTNDIVHKNSKGKILNNYEKLLASIKAACPSTKVYIHSIPPTRNHKERDNGKIKSLNAGIYSLSIKYKYIFIDLFKLFADSSGQMDSNYSFDGVHPNGKAYILWKQKIAHFVNE